MQSRKSSRNTMTKASSVGVKNVCAPCRQLSLKKVTFGLVLFVLFGACLHIIRSTYMDSQEPVEQNMQTEQIHLAESPRAQTFQNIRPNMEQEAKEPPVPAKPKLSPPKQAAKSAIKSNSPAPIKKAPAPSPAKTPQIKANKNIANKPKESKKGALQTKGKIPPKEIPARSTHVQAKSQRPKKQPPTPPSNKPRPVPQKTNSKPRPSTTQLVGQDKQQSQSTGNGPSIQISHSNPPKPAISRPSEKTVGSTIPKSVVSSTPTSGKESAQPLLSPVPNIKPPAQSTSKSADENQVTTPKAPLIMITQATSRWPIGYQMFSYAALQGVAVKNEMRPIFTGDMQISKMFNTRMETSLDLNAYGPFRTMPPQGLRCKNRSMNVVFRHKDKNYKMKGHWNSWHYFENVKSDIRNQFKFNEGINKTADKILRRKAKGIYGNSSYVLVGVHVRRSTTLKPSQWTPVAKLPPMEYFKNAMDYFRRRYKLVKFYVTGDNRAWIRRNIQGSDIIGKPHPLPEVDLAILSKCDHIIMSVGTFGWWGAWLANGTTIYYLPKNMTAPDSKFCKHYFFPPEWISME